MDISKDITLQELQQKHNEEMQTMREKYENLEKEFEELREENIKLVEQNNNYIDDLKLMLREAISGKSKRITELENKYLQKQKREKYKEQNVIYIITTERLEKDRVYILGKATNLTNRLSTEISLFSDEIINCINFVN